MQKYIKQVLFRTNYVSQSSNWNENIENHGGVTCSVLSTSFHVDSGVFLSSWTFVPEAIADVDANNLAGRVIRWD